MPNCQTGDLTSRSLVASSISLEITGVRTLIDNFSMSLNPGDKTGVIGAEGTGKSSLLWVLARRQVPGLRVQGSIKGAQRVGLLEQALRESWASSSITGFLLKSNPGDVIEPDRWNDLQRAVEAMIEVGLDPRFITGDVELTMAQLSGGERVRVRLAKLLLDDPDVWLLDEPTNDLDIPTLVWLERFIRRTERPIAFISHDETLLERCANRIVHFQRSVLSGRTVLQVEEMGYLEFVDFRRRSIEKQEQEAANQRRERVRAEAVLREHKSKVQSIQEKVKDSSARRLLNKKMRVITTRENKLEKNPVLERPEDVEAIQITFPHALAPPKGKTLLDFELSELSVGSRTLSQGVRLHIRGPEKVVIVGRNGAGKSTLIRSIVEQLSATESMFGYYPQKYEDELEDPLRTALDYVRNHERGVDATLAGILMARLNIARDEVSLPVCKLSGGQKAKIVLLRLMTGSGFLVLDEPTRNLSPLSNACLRDAFRQYPGAILAVSHDRSLIHRVADRILELTPGGLVPRTMEDLDSGSSGGEEHN